jgi:hypothetical protein
VRGVSTPKIEGEKPYDPSKRKRGDNGPSEYRMVGVSDNDRMTNAELEEFKAWQEKFKKDYGDIELEKGPAGWKPSKK